MPCAYAHEVGDLVSLPFTRGWRTSASSLTSVHKGGGGRSSALC